ncbi:MAG: BREX-3 system P-loop-containing protein BrxF [Deltaproteobacteria bacterium]|nr:BREX-3 system P-loop-containing protein BrxF [Deltaproteobacteria bacterium]
MNETIFSQIVSKIEEAAVHYYRLVLVVGSADSGKTDAVRKVAGQKDIPLLNVNLEMSRLLLDLTARQRAIRLPRLMGDLLGATESQVVLLDNTEILFDPLLQQDPLRLLQNLSRNRTLVATWNGILKDGCLVYAEPGHPEYRRYPIGDFLLVSTEAMS